MKILTPICIPVSSPDSLGDLADDHPGPRLDWLSKVAVKYIHMLALDDYFAS